MALPIINKDTDATVELTLKDEAGLPIDIATLAGMVVLVYQERFDIDKFSLNAQVGFGTINVTDAPNGVFRVYINNAKTANGICGKPIYYEIKTTAVDANFTGGTVEKSTGGVLLATLEESKLKSTTFI
jgi:hypothetical protein